MQLSWPKKISAIIFYLLILFFPQRVLAQTDAELFDTELHTTVTVSDTGASRVKHQFTITNKTPTTYISQYGLKISSAELKNVTVVSNAQVIKPEVVFIKNDQQSGPGQTSIGITFPEKLVGEGKVRNFTISYTHPDAAVISGQVLEVTLPPQANPKDYSEYSVTLITPAQFGGPIRTTPVQHSFTASGNQIVTEFEQGEERGVFALFGQEQFFNLDITYYLENATNNLGITQIALPPDTAYQQLHYHQLDPKPEKMEYDADGNWIATYKVPAGSTTAVQLYATAKLDLEPNDDILIPLVNDDLLSAQEYWPVNNRDIQELAQKYTTPEEINDFVVQTLDYNTQIALGLPERLGAIGALNNPQDAVCQEFTDLFVTLARSANIPARRVTGYAHSQNSELRPLSLVEDILHSWPEYYQSQTNQWKPIDPTWEDTTGGVDYFHQVDLNHIVFAINGANSVTPHPAGSYKPIGSTEKTVFVEFGTEFPEHQSQLSVAIKPRKFLGVNIPGLYELEITNLDGQAEYQLPLKFTAAKSKIIAGQKLDELPILLPFQTYQIPLRVENQTNFFFNRDTIEINILNESQEFELITSPPFDRYFSQRYSILALAGGAIIITLISGSLLVFKRKK